MRDLTPLLEPKSVAVIGASATPGKPGNILLKNILDGGYSGRVYPINRRAEEILGRRVYPTIEDVPERVDLAFLTIPRDDIPGILRSCVEHGVRAAVIITAGFGEAGGEGARLQAELEAIIGTSDILVTGPNTIGLISAPANLIASFVPFPHWHRGSVGIFAQTGLFGGGLMNELMSKPFQHPEIQYSLMVGNKAGVDEVDFLGYVGNSAAVNAIGLHLEGVKHFDLLGKTLHEVCRQKPVVILKTARTGGGAKASLVHTGSHPVDDIAFDAMVRASGAIRAEDIEDFLAILTMFAWQPLPRGRRVGIVTWTGAQGVIAMDQLEDNGLQAAEFANATLAGLAEHFPLWCPVANPVDIWLVMDREPRRVAEDTFHRVLADPGTDAVLGIVLAIEGGTFSEVREVFSRLRDQHPDKPLTLVIWGPDRERWLDELQGLRIPVYTTTRTAIRALAAATRYAEIKGSGTRLSPAHAL